MGFCRVFFRVCGGLLMGLVALSAVSVAAMKRSPQACATMLVAGVAVPTEALSLMAKARKLGDELYFLAFAGEVDGEPRLVIVMGEEPVLSPRGALIRDLVLKRFDLQGFGGGAINGEPRDDAHVVALDSGFDPGPLKGIGEGWSNLRSLVGLKPGSFIDRDRAHHMVRTAIDAWESHPDESVMLLIVGENHTSDMIDEFARLDYQWIELPGQRPIIVESDED